MSRWLMAVCFQFCATASLAIGENAARAPDDSSVLFANERVFDGKSGELSGPGHVLVRGNKIAQISSAPIAVNPGARIIDGGGRTLMPGLIDAHTHIMFATLSPNDVLTGAIG